MTARNGKTSAPPNNAAKRRGKPFEPGHAGRPPGARNKATLAVEALLDGEAEKLTRVAIDKALAGDTVALRICLDRIAPPRKGRPMVFTLPPVETAADTVKALGALLAAVAGGELSPEEGASVAALLETSRKALELADIEARISALEAKP